MTIAYANGRTVQAVPLARTESSLRAAVQGAEDTLEISEVGGAWITADCEPVTIEFAWQRLDRKPKISEADCLCSRELAARLVHLLFTDSGEDNIRLSAALASQTAFGAAGALAAI